QARVTVDETYAHRGAEQTRQAGSAIFSLQNSIKAFTGAERAGADPELVVRKEKQEQDFHAKVDANATWKAQFGGAWDAIAAATQRDEARVKQHYAYEFDSRLENLARTIVEYVTEVHKPAGERLPGFQDSDLQSLRYQIYSRAPVYPDFEKARLAGSLSFAEEQLGADDPLVKAALNGTAPTAVADAVIGGTRLADAAIRKQLIEGGEAAVRASTDPLIVFERKLDPILRAEMKWRRENVESVTEHAGEQLGKARFLVYGKSIYPDATFTLRLSYGQVKGYSMNGTIAPPITTFFGLYDRANSFGLKRPFNLVERFETGPAKLALNTPLNFVTTNDVVGGNSGSPVVNRAGELVGLVFDGNIESLAGDWIYDERTNRTVSVHTAGITEALRKLYNVRPLLSEIGINGD
ncbi:MAG: S46 family peptidase, partial [Acidobacteriaceae bacterium]|nr:S46 family peptidase [Acidobacteriaceae bacterium]